MTQTRRGFTLLTRWPVAARLFVTVLVVYSIHFASNVVRETYLAIALGDNFSVRVDKYAGLHPDLFEIPGRGAYIDGNPGAGMLGAIPYAISRPLIAGLMRARPELARPKPAATYNDPRPNRTRFMNEARRRGFDVKLGLAALSMHAGLMAPLGALGALVMFIFLRGRLGDERRALVLSLLYAFGTPIFFRSAFLNQNALVAHSVLFAYVLLVGVARSGVGGTPSSRMEFLHLPPSRRIVLAGLLVGFAILCDYSGAALAAAFAVWLAVVSWRRAGASAAIRSAFSLAAGAAAPVALLFLYQWIAFGNPWLPAQAYMPATQYSVRGWHGFSLPTPGLLAANLFDPAFGLFAFCPMLLASLAAPFIRKREREGGPTGEELALIFGASLALFIFASSVQFAALQFNTGVRYMVPAAPLLFIALVPVLLRVPRWLAFALVVPTLIISWSVSMARESVPVSLTHLLHGNFELPLLTVLRKMSGAYSPFLAEHPSPLPVFAVVAFLLWLIWRPVKLQASRR